MKNKRGRPKKIIEVVFDANETKPEETPVNPLELRLKEFTKVYQFLLGENIHSISSLEVKIAQMQQELNK